MSGLRDRRTGWGGITVVFVVLFIALVVPSARAGETPAAACGPGSRPETDVQGRIPKSDYDSGRTAQGYQCNAELVGHDGDSGGFRVHRYIDGAGHECAYYDTTLLVGTSVLLGPNAGVAVLDMTDPTHPVRTALLVTPAMLSPHESLNLNQKRGLLAAIDGSPITAPGVVDIYDVSSDCRHPALKWSGPITGAGHEATFAPDGNTFYTSAVLPFVSAIDVTNPSLPVPLWASTDYSFHGMNVSDDGNRLYAVDPYAQAGLTILDVSQIQRRVANPQVSVVSHMTWDNVSIPQTAIPVTIDGHPFLVEIDEFVRNLSTDPAAPVGAARMIDIADDTHPVVVSEMRLEANDAASRAGPQQDDPGATDPAQGYAGHYCGVPQRNDPGIVACSFILSGLRVFDIHDPYHPKEIAYFNPPTKDVVGPTAQAATLSAVPKLYVCKLAVLTAQSAQAGTAPPDPADVFKQLPASPFYGNTLTHWAMSAPTFAPDRREVWYSDGMYGFYAVRLTNDVWAPSAPVAAPTPTPAPESTPSAPVGTTQNAALPRTGWTEPTLLVAALLAFAVGGARLTALARR
jgi:hypothetical protein